ncbi:MAG: hypothetical protein WAT66_14675 [Actinomycetota bacterium]
MSKKQDARDMLEGIVLKPDGTSSGKKAQYQGIADMVGCSIGTVYNAVASFRDDLPNRGHTLSSERDPLNNNRADLYVPTKADAHIRSQMPPTRELHTRASRILHVELGAEQQFRWLEPVGRAAALDKIVTDIGAFTTRSDRVHTAIQSREVMRSLGVPVPTDSEFAKILAQIT